MITDATPHIVVVDNFYKDPDEVRALALRQEFQASDGHKGKRTLTRHIFDGTKEKFEQLLGRTVTNWGYGTNGVFQYCVGGDPIVYHSDKQTHAAVVYLTPDAPPEAGTSVWKSKTTGMMFPPNEADCKCLHTDADQIINLMYGHKLLDPTAWELVDTMGNVYNRLVIWNARAVHSAACYFGDSIHNGRLFQMFFFDCA